MSDELRDSELRANRLADQVESLRGDNTRLAKCVNDLRAVHLAVGATADTLRQQRDTLLMAIHNLSSRQTASRWKAVDAAVANCKPVAETISGLKTAGEHAILRLDAALERAHDENQYDVAVAIKDAAGWLNAASGATYREAAMYVEEMDADAARGGLLDGADDPLNEPAIITQEIT